MPDREGDDGNAVDEERDLDGLGVAEARSVEHAGRSFFVLLSPGGVFTLFHR